MELDGRSQLPGGELFVEAPQSAVQRIGEVARDEERHVDARPAVPSVDCAGTGEKGPGVHTGEDASQACSDVHLGADVLLLDVLVDERQQCSAA